MVIGLEQGADLHVAQLMQLPLTVCCFSKIQIGFTFLVPAHPGSPGQRAIKRVYVCVCLCVYMCYNFSPAELIALINIIHTVLLLVQVNQLLSTCKDQ